MNSGGAHVYQHKTRGNITIRKRQELELLARKAARDLATSQQRGTTTSGKLARR
jgi:hypothetical protein